MQHRHPTASVLFVWAVWLPIAPAPSDILLEHNCSVVFYRSSFLSLGENKRVRIERQMRTVLCKELYLYSLNTVTINLTHSFLIK
jgi:hypothetical protein